MDREEIVVALVDRCKLLIEKVLSTSEDNGLSVASLLLFDKFRDVARQTLQAWADLRARELRADPVDPCCKDAAMHFVSARSTTVLTLFGEVSLPVRTCRCTECKTYRHPDDRALGVPEKGAFTDDVRSLLTPLVAELPHRVASDLLEQLTGVRLSSRGAQGIIDSVARDVAHWRDEQENEESESVARVLDEDAGEGELRLEVAMDGVKAHIDGRWMEPKVASLQVRRVVSDGKEPQLGEVVARRYTCVLGSADDLGASIRQVIRESEWSHLRIGAVLGDGAPWIWNLAGRLFPGAPQILDWFHLKEHFYEFANAQFGEGEPEAKAWVDAKMLRLGEDRVGDVLSALNRMKPRNRTASEERSNLARYVKTNKGRIAYKKALGDGGAIGSGAVEGACKHLIQARFKRAGMRWKRVGFLNVLELRVARLNGNLSDFWKARGLPSRGVA